MIRSLLPSFLEWCPAGHEALPVGNEPVFHQFYTACRILHHCRVICKRAVTSILLLNELLRFTFCLLGRFICNVIHNQSFDSSCECSCLNTARLALTSAGHTFYQVMYRFPAVAQPGTGGGGRAAASIGSVRYLDSSDFYSRATSGLHTGHCSPPCPRLLSLATNSL